MKAVKITRIQQTETGILIGFAAGSPTVNGETGTIEYESKAAVRQAMRELKDRLSNEDLVLLSLSYALKNDPQLGVAALAARINKVLTVDLEGAASPITVS